MNYDFYDDISFMMNNSGIDLFSPYEGYLAGNAFKNQYIPYKNYKIIRPNINSEQEEMLLNIGEYSFMMHDMNLYLDIYPNNQEALNKFNEYRNKTNELITKYERKYGPLMVKSTDDTKAFNWVSKWPWVN